MSNGPISRCVGGVSKASITIINIATTKHAAAKRISFPFLDRALAFIDLQSLVPNLQYPNKKAVTCDRHGLSADSLLLIDS